MYSCGVHQIEWSMHCAQVLVEKDPALLGKMFEVEITITGKHFLKGSVIKESLVNALPRPLPLPEGCVSGVESWQKKLAVVGGGDKPLPTNSRGFGMDLILLTIAAAVLSIALLTRFISV